MIKKAIFAFTCLFFFVGCSKTPTQSIDTENPPKTEDADIYDAGETDILNHDSGISESPPAPLDAGNSPNSTPVSDAGPQAPARDAGNATNGVSDAGMTVPASPVDAGQNQPIFLQGDAGLLEIPNLPSDGGPITPDAFLYIRNVYLAAEENGFVEVMIHNDVPLGGLQFIISGITPIAGSTSGGLVENTNGFSGTITAGGQFLAFTMTSDTLPPHNGTLTEIPIAAITAPEICITDVVVSNETGTELLSYAECTPVP